MNAPECLQKAEKKEIKRGTGKIVHEMWIEKVIWETDEYNLMDHIKMIKLKGQLTNVEIEKIRRRQDNEDRDEENNMLKKMKKEQT